jgi:hypothetical protein
MAKFPAFKKRFGASTEPALTEAEFHRLGETVTDELALAAHKFRGLSGFQLPPGNFLKISETDFINLINEDPETLAEYGYENLDEAEEELVESVSVGALGEMLARSFMAIPEDMYVIRTKFIGGSGKTGIDVKKDSLYSATFVDPADDIERLTKHILYGKNFKDSYVIKLEKGTVIYHPSDESDGAEVVIQGQTILNSKKLSLESIVNDDNITKDKKHQDYLNSLTE